MITTKQIVLPKELPFDGDKIESRFKEMGLDVLRWAVVNVTETSFVIDAAIITKNNNFAD